MNTKGGIPIPEDLAHALQATRDMREAWDGLRPSCQRDYVARIATRQDPQMRQQRIQQVLKRTADYAARHPNKHPSR